MEELDFLTNYINEIKNIEGCFGEFGVFMGDTFLLLIKQARLQNKKIFGFDSFRGMGNPTEFDIDPRPGAIQYPKGKFDVGGSSGLKLRLSTLGYKDEIDYELIEGFIPQTLYSFPSEIIFSFAYVDLDHYLPTKYTLEWLWERLSVSGIILCDDYFEMRNFLASKAIEEFREKIKCFVKFENRKILFKKKEKEA